ncbi:MAG: hypothetical protein ACI8QD_002929 [Cyclobacteriaceae bacterium]|jgi:hypothetical protein
MSISYLTHESKPIMFANYLSCKTAEQQLALLEEVAKAMASKVGGVRLLVDYNEISAGPSYMSRVKELGSTVFEQHMKCSAILGVTKLKKILFNGYNRAIGATNVKTFEIKEAAIDWLANFG